LYKKINDIEACLDLLSLLKSNSKKTLSFKKFASAYLKNMYQGTSTPLTKSQAINSNSENSNDNMFEVSKSHAELTKEEEKKYHQNKKKKFIYQEYSTDDYKHHTMIMGANKFYWILIGFFVLDSFIGYIVFKDGIVLPRTIFHWLIFPNICSASFQFYYFITSDEFSDTSYWTFLTGNYTFDQLIIKPLRLIITILIHLILYFLMTVKFVTGFIVPYFVWRVYNWINDK
jgi:hypothetical protein